MLNTQDFSGNCFSNYTHIFHTKELFPKYLWPFSINRWTLKVEFSALIRLPNLSSYGPHGQFSESEGWMTKTLDPHVFDMAALNMVSIKVSFSFLFIDASWGLAAVHLTNNPSSP